MQITINDKLIEQSLAVSYDDTITHHYEKNIRKAAKVFGKKEFVAECMADTKVLAAVNKKLTKYMNDADFINELIYDVEIKLLDQMVDDCELVLDAEYQKQADDMADQEIEYMIRSLNAAGYRVEKTV